MLKHLEELKNPKNQRISQPAKAVEAVKPTAAVEIEVKKEEVVLNVVPKGYFHKRTRSDCDKAKAQLIKPALNIEDEYFRLGQEEDPRKSNRLTSRRSSNIGVGTAQLQAKTIVEDNGEHMQNPPQVIGSNAEDTMEQDKERLILYNQQYWAKHKDIPPTSTDYYKFVKLIGKGAFGKVTLGIHKLTGKYVAIKTIEKSYMKDEFSRKKVFREVYILKKIRHANVIRLLEVFESSKHLLIVMEFAGGGDLLQYVKKHKRLSESEAKTVFRQVVYGIGHIHSRSVLHRDIKLDNILLDQDHGVKICDFGVSKIIDKSVTIKEQCGTPAYIAPEIISEQVCSFALFCSCS